MTIGSGWSRRDFLRGAAAAALGFGGLHRLMAQTGWVTPSASEIPLGFGPLRPDPAKVLDLPEGFVYRVISRLGEPMSDGLVTPGRPDGMAAFSAPNGRVLLVCNHENTTADRDLGPFGPNLELLPKLTPGSLYDAGGGVHPGLGGTTSLLYNPDAGIVEAKWLSLAGTYRNCAGGPTPWGSWITCEEDVTPKGVRRADVMHGYNFEVPARLEMRPAPPIPLTDMGRFNHEAVAVDPATGIVYMTEDQHDGLLYRFIPNVPGELAAGGRLQALALRDTSSADTRNWVANGRVPVGEGIPVAWIDMQEVEAPDDDDLRLRGFASGAARFARGEGMWWGEGCVYFACTNGGAARKGQIWRYVPGASEGAEGEADTPGVLTLFVEPNNGGIIDNADNLTVSPFGDLIVCEDGSGEQFLVGITPAGGIYKFARNAASTSELAGACFSPDGSTLFVNLQEDGLTLAITGPWEGRRA